MMRVCTLFCSDTHDRNDLGMAYEKNSPYFLFDSEKDCCVRYGCLDEMLNESILNMSMPPSAKPTAGPSSSPTAKPTEGPSSSPTAKPTAGPSSSPSLAPTSGSPTSSPTRSLFWYPDVFNPQSSGCIYGSDYELWMVGGGFSFIYESEEECCSKFLCKGSSAVGDDMMIACPMNYQPVCGSDNKVYSNTCKAGAAGVESDCELDMDDEPLSGGDCNCRVVVDNDLITIDGELDLDIMIPTKNPTTQVSFTKRKLSFRACHGSHFLIFSQTCSPPRCLRLPLRTGPPRCLRPPLRISPPRCPRRPLRTSPRSSPQSRVSQFIFSPIKERASQLKNVTQSGKISGSQNLSHHHLSQPRDVSSTETRHILASGGREKIWKLLPCRDRNNGSGATDLTRSALTSS